MYREETLAEPCPGRPGLFREIQRHRIRQGQSFVWMEDGEVLFKTDISCWSSHGAQLSGVYTNPNARRRGVAKQALGAICQRLLSTHPRLTLYVNEDNKAAIKLYQQLGFRYHHAYQSIFVT